MSKTHCSAETKQAAGDCGDMAVSVSNACLLFVLIYAKLVRLSSARPTESLPVYLLL